ncbi:GNAT family N-acetyltransferase [Erythrobacter sp. AP23]|uniref:GNAT family N-acetyltransferase n=1 Tax=Erythrobacter sp. AP23 TaxID=499656 RepID=UPI000AFE89A0|nr:GNAT family N-acetyltransferase [Erythrobacter sp. AP23]
MSNAALDIRLLGPDDYALVNAAEEIFDDRPIAKQTHAFLNSDRDFLWFALIDGQPVGFASATIVLHPDKSPHLFVNELETRDGFRRRGIATRLMRTVQQHGKANGLWPIWLAAEGDDDRAIAFYRSLGDMEERGAVVFEWE